MNTDLLLPFLGEALAKSLLLLLAAAAIERAWRRASAAHRHLVWLGALVAVLLLPLTSLFAPSWSVSLVPRTTVPEMRAHDSPPQSGTAALSEPVQVARAAWRDWDVSLVVMTIWGAGVALILAGRVAGSVRLVRLRRSSELVTDPRVQRMAVGILTELGIRRRVALRLSCHAGVPLTCGTWRPLVMLPAAALGWDDTRLSAALRHEAGHIRRGDHFTCWLAQIACALYWPNPLIWMAARRLRTAQEEATDDLVLRAGAAPAEYAEQLLDLARVLAGGRRAAGSALCMAAPAGLERRLRALLEEGRDRRPVRLRLVVGMALGVAAALALASVTRLRGDEKALRAKDWSGRPSVTIESKFVEMSPSAMRSSPELAHLGPGTPPGSGGILEDPQFAQVIRALNMQRGVDLLSAPSVTAHSGQRATVEIVREFKYPTKWKKEGAGWKPTKFATRTTGVTLEVRADVQPDGRIMLHATPRVVELLGWLDLDTGRKYPEAPKRPSGLFAEGTSTPPEGHRMQAVFSERTTTRGVRMQSGETVVLANVAEVSDTKGFAHSQQGRAVSVFVSARYATAAPLDESRSRFRTGD
jgi:beta-lactamase regulating signal transducer with metallopeptidase domain